MENNKILKKFQDTDVTIEMMNGVPMFELYSVGMALGYINKRTSKGKEYISPYKSRIDKVLKNAEIQGLYQGVTTYLTENQLYDFMIEAHTDKCKEFKKWLTIEVLPVINKTGGYVMDNREEDFVDNYLAGLSEDVKILVIKDLKENSEKLRAENKRLQQFYDDLLNTEGLLAMNLVAKQLKIGLKRLYAFLRDEKILFYRNGINTPYQSSMEQGLFEIRHVPCRDGNYRPQTFATEKGLEYIRKKLIKNKDKYAYL